MHHLLVHAPAAWIVGAGSEFQIYVSKFRPDAYHLKALRFVSFHQEFVSHKAPLSPVDSRIRNWTTIVHSS